MLTGARLCPLDVDCVEKLRLISVLCADSFCWGAGDSADDGRAAGDAGGAVLRLQPFPTITCFAGSTGSSTFRRFERIWSRTTARRVALRSILS
jgi:hypothetical protein